MEHNLEETDNITKNIVQEIVRECKSQKFEIDESFCVYYVKLLTLDPFWKISPERKLNRENIQSIVTFIIEKLQTPHCIDLTTLKMQYAFLSYRSDKQMIANTHKSTITRILNPLFEEILSINMDDIKASETKLIRKVAFYITLKTGLGNPKHGPVLREAMFALKSIWDENDINEFVKENVDAKCDDLKHVEDLVTGIRLFNRDCGRPSAEIEDLPKMLSQALTALSHELQSVLVDIMEEVNITTTAVENIFVLNHLREPKHFQQNDKIYEITTELELKCPEGVTEDDVQEAVNLLILCRQYEVYIRKLLKDIEFIDDQTKTLFSNLEEILKKIHQAVEYKVAVSINVVFPLFVELSQTWRNIQNETIVLSTFAQIFQNFKKLRLTINPNFDLLKLMLGSQPVLTDAVRLENTMGELIPKENNLCKVIYPTHFSNFEKLPLKYLGFCVWSLVYTNGGLIPGNPNMGVCVWKNNFYVFAGIFAATEFGKDPDLMIMKSLSLVRNKPELITLLELHEDISALRHIGELYKKPVEIVMAVCNETQTLVHPVPEYIDPNYVWNIWDYYRLAIKLANITKCQTHSVQTLKSHYRAPQFAQTTEPRDKMCQTKKDNYMNVATPSNFIFGLRGRKDNVQHVIELTRPVDEKKFYQCATANADAPIYVAKSKKCRSWKRPVKKKEKSSSVSSSVCYSTKKDVSSNTSEEYEEGCSLSDCLCVTGVQVKNN